MLLAIVSFCLVDVSGCFMPRKLSSIASMYDLVHVIYHDSAAGWLFVSNFQIQASKFVRNLPLGALVNTVQRL